MKYSLFISCPRNLEYLLEEELTALGLAVTRVSPMGVYGQADLALIYQLCLWSRIANRVQVILFSGKVDDASSIVSLCRQFAWDTIFDVDKKLVIDFHGESSYINNTMYGAQLIKDGIVDYFKPTGQRPDIDKKYPDIRLHAHLKNDVLVVSLDCVGYSLHQRGYREQSGGAPVKENLAAAILLRANWPAMYDAGQCLLDPFCGSGTLLIEGALMAGNIAPGLLRQDQRLIHWKAHDPALWEQAVVSARQQQKTIDVMIQGSDSDPKVIAIARSNIAKAGLSDVISVEQRAVKDFKPTLTTGLIVTNPPYGERLKDTQELVPLYQSLGKVLHDHCQGFSVGVFTANPLLAQSIGLRYTKQYQFFNGPLKATLYCITVDADNTLKNSQVGHLNPHVQALSNRLRKNLKHLKKWLARTDTNCYRLYDADLPDYAFVVDVYNDWAHVQEYAPPKEIPEAKAKKRILEMLQILPDILGIPAKHIVLKQRKKQKGSEQYVSLNDKRQVIQVYEGQARFRVNLHDYLDTGLFLDHRPLRLQFNKTLAGKRLLNCFCYTGAFSVQAALAGAKTCNVDLSKTYLNWAKDNFRLNYLSLNSHQFIQADCLQWFGESHEKFDVILLDPPSFSNSKRMEDTLDILRDHVQLIDGAMAHLAVDGVLYFSTNRRHFKLSDAVLAEYKVKDITQRTIDEDFKRHAVPHYCFEIELRKD